TQLDVPLDELRAGVGNEVQVDFAAGFGVGTTHGDDELAREAVELARDADHVLVFLGLPAADESEGFDRTHMELPANQVRLVEALAEVHDRLIVVLANGSAVRLSTWQDKVSAILECWLSGQAAGGAAADLLLGIANPSGKLAETIPVRLEDNPSYLNFPGDSQIVRYGEGIFIGYRAYDRLDQVVSYPFGFGLSYTTFEISNLYVVVNGSVENGDLAVSVAVSVANTGQVAGAEVVQLYVRDVESSVARPVRELKAFAKVALEPGESRQVRFQLDERSFAFWSVLHGRWAVEAGNFEIAVGSSSRDLTQTQTITLDAPRLALPLTKDSTLQEWLADEKGRALLESEHPETPLVKDPEFVTVVGSMPMSTLAGFPGMGVDHSALDNLIARL
ncbi:MAG: beta-glucosidase, partial [Propionibacteriaceae bacterium]|nr:beta-glucosidase [Propionibacteriaceae bacterium]